MQNYINGAILEAIQKADALKGKIPGSGKQHTFFDQLTSKAESEIDSIKNYLQYLLNDVDFQNPTILKEKFTTYKELYGRLSLLENVVIAALTRSHEDDVYVNKLVEVICREVQYPITKPVASCLSKTYYHIYPDYNLLCLPLLEADFLLHIPDIYHELAHPIISHTDNPKVKKFQDEQGKLNSKAKKYFDEIISKENRNGKRQNLINFYQYWKFSWMQNWSTEFFCDLYGIYTLGPAFAWSNLHLCVKMSNNIFKIPYGYTTSHPPDDARMQVMFIGLELIGFSDESHKIRDKWNEFKAIKDAEETEYYDFCIPLNLLEQTAIHALEATRSINSNIVNLDSMGKIATLLNDAWSIFWDDQNYFIEWEREQVDDLKKKWLSVD